MRSRTMDLPTARGNVAYILFLDIDKFRSAHLAFKKHKGSDLDFTIRADELYQEPLSL
jgi:hypothetical protein